MNKVIVVDIETLDTSETAHILTIGAVGVDLDSQEITDEFYMPVNEVGQRERTISDDTLAWWVEQEKESPQAHLAAFHRRHSAKTLGDALLDFELWMSSCVPDIKKRQLFGNGPEFDNKILENAYSQCEINVPWRYSNNQSIRTIAFIGKSFLDFNHYNMEFVGVKHHALDDARHEAKVLLKVWGMLSEGLC